MRRIVGAALSGMLALAAPCGARAQMDAPAKPEVAMPAAKTDAAMPAAKPDAAMPAAKADAGQSKPAAAKGAAVFPTVVNAKYASQKPGKARLHTCLDQYHANKDDGGNGGLNWVQKGGGYFSQCSKRLKAGSHASAT